MDEGSGNLVGDMSGHGKTGTISGASWTAGKRGHALSFDGTNDYVDAGNVNSSVKTVSFWIKASSTTNRIIDLNGTAKVELSGGTITTNGITSPTIYVDGAVSSTLDTNWHYVTITTDTGIDVSAATLGQGDAWGCGDTLTDSRDSKNYATVQIGNQCWMKQGLNVGTRIAGGTSQGISCASINKWCYDNLDTNCDTNNNPNYPDGGLYQWDQMMCGSTTPGIQGICPAGWHLPSDEEMCVLENAVDSTITSPCSVIDWRGIDGGTKLKPNGSSGWEGNLSGGNQGIFEDRTVNSYFWSSSEYNISRAWTRIMSSGSAQMYRGWGFFKSAGFSVRCVKDAAPTPYFSGKLDEVRMYDRALAAGEVTTLYQVGAVKYKSPNNAGLVGYWAMEENTGTQAGDSSGNHKNGTISGTTWVDGKRGKALSFDGTNDYVDFGEVDSSVKTISFWVKADTTTNKIFDLNSTAKMELSSGTITTSGITSPTIYVDGVVGSTLDTNWHYVTITTGTGINASATTLGKSWSCGDTLSYNGDSYTTVQTTATYGSQCWLQENLRTIYKPDGVTGITNYCNPAGCGSPWGRLYERTTVMNGSANATGCGAKIQGICPSGWHIPSDYAGCSTDDFPALGTDGGALKQAGTANWNSPNTGATNASNWTGYPAGFYFAGAYRSRNDYAAFWSSALVSSNGVYRVLDVGDAGWDRLNISPGYPFSLRCVKDVPPTPYFSGKLDEVRMYNRVLSATEVASLYQASGRKITINSSQNSVVTTGLVGQWSFNGADISGSTAYDRSGQGKNGTITGASKTIGKVGQALSLNGTSDSVDLGNVYDGVKSVTFWVKTSDVSDNGYFAGKLDEVRFYSTTLSAAEIRQLYGAGTSAALTSVRSSAKLVALNGSASVKVLNGTIGASGFSSPIIYVDGTVASTIDDNWRFVAVTTGTGINASATTMGLGYAFECGIDNISFSYKGSTVAYGTVDVSGQCWMDRNLGASQAATAYNDSASYGDYFQWGRLDDNHQNSNSGTTATPSSSDVPGHGNFIVTATSPYDWRSPQNNNLWSSASGYVNNPCPVGWHVPSQTEWSTAMTNLGLASCSSSCREAVANSSLKISLPSNRNRVNGSIAGQGSYGYYWSSSPYITDAYHLYVSSGSVNSADYADRAGGHSVRCLKD
jgi:uncharacterized protein (TIGR02145 family)